MPRGAGSRWVVALARVEWLSESRAGERPSAVLLGGERREVEVERGWVEAQAEAGGPVRRVFVVRDAAGRRYRLTQGSGGGERVEIDVETGGAGLC